jgi:hypothetical protein
MTGTPGKARIPQTIQEFTPAYKIGDRLDVMMEKAYA